MAEGDLRERAEATAEFVKAFANPNRLMILCALLDGEKAVGDLEVSLDIHQPGLSQHLASLRQAGLVAGRRRAKQVYYSLSTPQARTFTRIVAGLLASGSAPDGPATPSRPVEIRQAAVFARTSGR